MNIKQNTSGMIWKGILSGILCLFTMGQVLAQPAWEDSILANYTKYEFNGAYIAIGLLYGEKDFGRTIDIAMRCGQDSDCNPSNAGGVLGTMLGFSGIPEPWKAGLGNIEERKLDHCDYSLSDVYRVNYRLAGELV